MIGKTIKDFRKHHNIKQVAVAAVSGISQTRLSQIENGWVVPRPDEVRSIKSAISELTKGQER
jgi:transcriptional regulator with XRE-family HTH domain